jgi:hypothetical protein
MDRKQTETPRKPDRAELALEDVVPKEHRYGEGAASALASLKKRERERAKSRPADDRPTS